MWIHFRSSIYSFISSDFFSCISDALAASSMQGMEVVHTNLDDDAEQLREDFQMFVRGLAEAMSKRSEQEEMAIMNSRG